LAAHGTTPSRLHLLVEGLEHSFAHVESRGDRLRELALLAVHRLDHGHLALVDRLSDIRECQVGHRRGIAAEAQRQLIGERDRPVVLAQHLRQPGQKTGTIVARPADGLAQFYRILRFEMAAAEVVGAGERHERDLALLPQGQDAILERGVQA
ncbi:hypothetical protein QT20_00150, partial [Staphylococcus aureus]